MKWKYFYFLLILFIFVADQSTKVIVSKTVIPHTKIVVIPGFFNLTHIHNRGAIFGFFPGNSLLITAASLLALILVVYYFFKTPSTEKTMKISLSLILGGALGNLVDRVARNYVVDFADFYISKWHWPSFNVADSSITIGALLLVFVLLKGRKNVSHTV